MFIFNKKHQTPPDYSLLGTDIHSHLLPGIDDGSPDVDTSVSLIRGLRELGFKKLITTPHVMGDMYPNTPSIIQDRFVIVKEAMKMADIQLDFSVAAEYFIDDKFVQQLHENKELLSISSKYLLCEFSMLSPNDQVKKIVFDLQLEGYQVIIAHPERYVYLSSNRLFYDELKDMGCYFQLNLLALGAYYGKNVQSLTQYLLKKGYYDFAATDLHNQHQLDSLNDPAIGVGLKRLVDSCHIQNGIFGIF